MSKKKPKQTEAHDWLGDSAESLVRYYFAKAKYIVYGASKWGADCVVQDRKSNKILTVEIKSTDTGKSPSYLKSLLKQKLEKISKVARKPDIFAGVRLLKECKEKDYFEVKLFVIDKKRNGVKRGSESLKLCASFDIRNWTNKHFKTFHER